jgi:uncharacterized protein YhjY with autotransporter beta-barrel domain
MRSANILDRRWASLSRAASLGALACVVSSAANAANPAFQDFFQQNVCNSPLGELQNRCTEWTGVVGDLSGDSESSLNPSHSLSNNDTALDRALNYSKQARERGDDLRSEDESEPDSGAELQFGRLNLLFQVRGSSYESSKIQDVDSERGYEGDYYGTSIGFDYRVSPRAFIGVQLGFDTADQDFVRENTGVNFDPDSTAGSIKSDTVSISVTGSINFTDSVYFVGAAGYSNTSFDLYRNSIFQESGRTPSLTRYVRTRADVDGDQTWATLNIGMDLGQRAVSFGPYFGVTLASSSLDAYSEREVGDIWGLAMSYSATDRDSMLGYVGFHATINHSSQSGVLSTQFRVEFQHESDKDPASVTTGFLLDGTGAQFTLSGDRPDRDQAEIGFGILKVMSGGWHPYFDIAVLTGNDTLDRYRWAAGFRKEF